MGVNRAFLCLNLGKSLNPSEPRFPPLLNGDCNKNYLGLLWGLKELIGLEDLPQCQAHATMLAVNTTATPSHPASQIRNLSKCKLCRVAQSILRNFRSSKNVCVNRQCVTS